ncbi:hypothetical protein Z043-115784 [Arapaima gigas]
MPPPPCIIVWMVLHSTVGEFNPILKIVFQATSLLLNGPESKEGQYLSKQFLNLDQNLDALKNQIAVILQQIPFYSMNLYCDHEASIIFQYEMFMDFVHASPEYKSKKKDLFLSQFRANKGDLPLTTLYDGITDGSILKTMLAKEEWNRKAVEVFCTKLKMLFLKGIIVVIVYSALKPSEEREVLEVKTQAGDIFVDKAEVTMWLQKMEDVERRLKNAVDECTETFATHAKNDMDGKLNGSPPQAQANDGAVPVEFLLTFLSTKYDWVYWSIRVVSPHTFWLFNWIAGTEYHDHSGSDNFFEIKTKDKIVVFSFSKERTCIDKDLIKKNIKRQQSRWNMAEMTLSLSKSLPDYYVHIVSGYKNVTESNKFPEDCYYYGSHGRAYVCIHSK